MMPERLGMTIESFDLCCRALAAAVRHETGYMNLREAPGRAGAIRLRSEGQKLENEKRASSFLFSVMHRGLLRAPRRSWMSTLTRLVTEGGAAHPEQDVSTFLRLFTRTRDLDPDLEPGLFLEPDEGTLALDLLSMNEFLNFCLRKLTTIDEAPTPEARRGARFEQAVWDFFRRHLKVELLVDVNSRFVSGTVQGEIDVAFRAGEVIVVLECKSWQKRRDYFRGDRKAIDRRHEQLRRTVEEQIPRNVGLLRSHLGEKASGDVVAFVCVAGPEFIKRAYPSLWYGATQRILTPHEILSLIKDAPRWRQTIEAARGSAPMRSNF
jgi:Holliday junction resolvase-like predicted endonuclease